MRIKGHGSLTRCSKNVRHVFSTNHRWHSCLLLEAQSDRNSFQTPQILLQKERHLLKQELSGKRSLSNLFCAAQEFSSKFPRGKRVLGEIERLLRRGIKAYCYRTRGKIEEKELIPDQFVANEKRISQGKGEVHFLGLV